MLRRILVVLFGLAIVLLVTGLLLPDHAKVERKIIINASTSTVYKYINGMKAFHEWSPWATIDPDTQYEFTGPDTGKGSKMMWSSHNRQVGFGSQVITNAVTNERVDTKLDFGEDSGGTAHFYLIDNIGTTEVIWSFKTSFGWDLPGRFLGLFLDKLLGPSYEQGLMNLKALVEKQT